MKRTFAGQQFRHVKENSGPSRRGLYRVASIALAVILVCSLGFGSAMAAGSSSDITLTYTNVNARQPMSAAEVYAATVNSTVGITTSGVSTNYWGEQAQSVAAGSGFIITADGYILTNYHVVEDSDSIKVATYDGNSYDAELIGYDASSDIAVLKIDANDLTPVVFGDSDELVVGEQVLAIGNPLGELTFSLTSGIVSALNREVTLSANLRMKLIQTDCSINAGNSGGVLLNMYGEAIGITNAKYSASPYETSIDNICFAIPVNTVVGIVEQIMTNGEISSPYIGISINDVGDDLADYGVPKGAHVVEVNEDSPSEEAGLQPKDIITAVNGSAIEESDDLVEIVRSCSVGDKLTMSVYRQGEMLQIVVTVGEQIKSALPEPEEPEETPEQKDSQGHYGQYPQGEIPEDMQEFYDFFQQFFS
ncbi:MAG: trypsin-like peptidase domain-containing protein [Oscillospiraceae bacterium]|nr:trypsin-like peptidase domain-containing protein [Oscillospiraceae bacterium]